MGIGHVVGIWRRCLPHFDEKKLVHCFLHAQWTEVVELLLSKTIYSYLVFITSYYK